MANYETWQAEIERRIAYGVALEFSPQDFAQSLDDLWPNNELSAFLDEKVELGVLSRLELRQCPNSGCHQILDQGMLQVGECAACQFEFALEGEKPVQTMRFRIDGETSRDIRWMIVLHGFNTRGPWQEDLSWLIANRLKYSAPVLIYKYGWATVDILSRPLHEFQAKCLGRKVRQAVQYASERGLPKKPDVIAHSFGTHLFTRLLQDPEFADLNFGRIITAGSIVRPDFDWSLMTETNRVEAVLNHMGGRDWQVQLAQFMIPGSGPGARVGYLDTATANHLDPLFGHSKALESGSLKRQLKAGGLWHRFLTQPEGRFNLNTSHRPKSWRPTWWGFRAITRLVGWIILLAFGPLSWLRRKFDP